MWQLVLGAPVQLRRGATDQCAELGWVEGNDGVNALGNDRKNPVLVSDIGEDD